LSTISSPFARLDAAPVSVAETASQREPGRYEAKAAAIHRLGRLRAKHFPTSLLADSAMSLLLSLFVAEQQDLTLSERTLALANQLSREEAAVIIDNLVHAGLSVISGEEPERRMVGRTPIGSARARGFVDDFPEV
jgi:hypothetical protein